jgi:anti-sigma B factor antagonist
MDEKIGVEISGNNKSAVISFKGASLIDADCITSAREQIKEFLRRNQPKKIVVDFSEVKFFSSQVLGILLDLRSRVAVYGGEVVISSIEPRLHRIFKITSLDKIFSFFPDKESAAKQTNSE